MESVSGMHQFAEFINRHTIKYIRTNEDVLDQPGPVCFLHLPQSHVCSQLLSVVLLWSGVGFHGKEGLKVGKRSRLLLNKAIECTRKLGGDCLEGMISTRTLFFRLRVLPPPLSSSLKPRRSSSVTSGAAYPVILAEGQA